MKPSIDKFEDQHGLLLPDLCSAQAVLLLVLVTELLALCLLLFAQGGGRFDWIGLGRTSLFMQWTTLASAGLLCMMRNWLALRPLVLGSTIAYLLIILLCALFSLTAEVLIGGLQALEPRLGALIVVVARHRDTEDFVVLLYRQVELFQLLVNQRLLEVFLCQRGYRLSDLRRGIGGGDV